VGPEASVVVVSYNTRELLAECLQAVRTESTATTVELWVVDNASTDGSAELVEEKFPEVRLIRNARNVGFAAANNQALARAEGELLFLLNSDAVLLPGSLRALQRAFRERPELGLGGPSLWNPDGSRQPSWGDFPRPRFELLFQSLLYKVWPCRFPYGRRVHPLLRRAYTRFRWVDWVTGAALMMRRAVYETLGGLPEDGFMYGEDLEYCARAGAAGFRVGYVPEARACHRLAGSRSDYARWVESYTRATLEFYRRHGTGAEQARVSRLVRYGSVLRLGLWSVVGGARPARRREAAMRCEGYRRAMALARSYDQRRREGANSV